MASFFMNISAPKPFFVAKTVKIDGFGSKSSMIFALDVWDTTDLSDAYAILKEIMKLKNCVIVWTPDNSADQVLFSKLRKDTRTAFSLRIEVMAPPKYTCALSKPKVIRVDRPRTFSMNRDTMKVEPGPLSQTEWVYLTCQGASVKM